MISPGAVENSRLSTVKERIRVDVGKGEDARRAVRAGEVVADRGAGFAWEKFKLLARGGVGECVCACERRVVLETQSMGASYKAGRAGSSLPAPYPTHRLIPKASSLPAPPLPTLPRAWGGK